MNRRSGMVLRRRSTSSNNTSLLRSRRTSVPPKKDDLSVLTWKEQQMIEKAQIASLKTSAKSSPIRGRLKRKRRDDINEDESAAEESSTSSNNSIIVSSDDEIISPQSSRLSSPAAPRAARMNAGMKSAIKNSKPSYKNGKRPVSSSRYSSSRQSFGSIGSIQDFMASGPSIISTSGGFAARKSAYMGSIDSDDEDEEEEEGESSSMDDEEDSEDADGPGTSRRLPPVESMPTTEDFVKYLIIKSLHYSPGILEYIGDLKWENVPLKRKGCGNSGKKAVEKETTHKAALHSPTASKPEQAWAKKAIERAKKSLIAKTAEKRPSCSPLKPSKKAKISSPESARSDRGFESKNSSSHGKKQPKQDVNNGHSNQQGRPSRNKASSSRPTNSTTKRCY